jgi:uncharacterized protein (DUF2235 family)
MSTSDSEVKARPPGPRQLIVCCDGTNNTLTGGAHDTNVVKVVGRLAPDENNQLVYYDPGVGVPDQMPAVGFLNQVTRKRERIAGLAHGKGVYENIAEAYSFLAENYAPGDQIYLFGFSRGAFTARCVAGMVHLFGILRADSKPLILTLIRVYFTTPSDNRDEVGKLWGVWTARRALQAKQKNEQLAQDTGMAMGEVTPDDVRTYFTRKKQRKITRKEVADQVRSGFTSPHGRTAHTHFVGVWDTVESVGIPLWSRQITSDGTTRQKNGFRHIRHALSMDEHRRSFTPRLYWDQDYTVDGGLDRADDRSLRQRWFRGAHSDVGGGYDEYEAGLADQAFRWMMAEAQACGLRTVAAPQRADGRSASSLKPFIAHDPCYDTPWWGVAGLSVRTNVSHVQDGRAQPLRVLMEGAACEPGARIHPAWSLDMLLRNYRFWLALACACLFWLACGWLAHAAFDAGATSGFFDRAVGGAFGFDAWQRGFFALCVDKRAACTAVPSAAAGVWAGIADLAFIAAYSWPLGLLATWAFREMTGYRRPDEAVAPVLALGYAPLFAVAADVAENLLTLLTLWSLSWNIPWLSGTFGLLMMLANLAKWTGLGGCLLLVSCGIFATCAPPLPAAARL